MVCLSLPGSIACISRTKVATIPYIDPMSCSAGCIVTTLFGIAASSLAPVRMHHNLSLPTTFQRNGGATAFGTHTPLQIPDTDTVCNSEHLVQQLTQSMPCSFSPPSLFSILHPRLLKSNPTFQPNQPPLYALGQSVSQHAKQSRSPPRPSPPPTTNRSDSAAESPCSPRPPRWRRRRQ